MLGCFVLLYERSEFWAQQDQGSGGSDMAMAAEDCSMGDGKVIPLTGVAPVVAGGGGSPTDGTQRLADCFERSARRWEMIIYPAMILFTLFAGIAFVQIYRLTTDIRTVAEQVQPQVGEQLVKLSESMQTLTASIRQISGDIRAMHDDIAKMQANTEVMARHIGYLETINANMIQMNQNMGVMTYHTDTMRWNMANMNRSMSSMSRPMNFMSSFMP